MPAGDTYARFYVHPLLDIPASQLAKRTVYTDIVNIEIFVKGDKNTSFGRAKIPEDENTFPKEWDAYVSGGEVKIEGTPLNNLPDMSPATLMNLNATGIMSIEDLSQLGDSVVIGTPGMVDLRKRAIAFVASMDDQEEPEKKTRRKRNKETGELE